MSKFILEVGTKVVISSLKTPAKWYDLQKEVEVVNPVFSKCPIRDYMVSVSYSAGFSIYFETKDMVEVMAASLPAPVVTPVTVSAPTPPPVGTRRPRNQYVSQIGARIDVSLRITRIANPIQGEYGLRSVISGLDATGCTVQFWTGDYADYTVGSTYTLRGTVTRHEQYLGWCQTTLNRVINNTVSDTAATDTPAAPAAPVAATGTTEDGVRVVEDFSATRTQVEIEQANREAEFDRIHGVQVDTQVVAQLKPYILTYDIPSTLGAFSPVARLRPIGYHLQGSVWVVNEDSLPWSLIKLMRDLGCDVQYYQFSTTEAQKLVRAAVRAIADEIRETRERAEALVEGINARMVRNLTETGMDLDEVVENMQKASAACQKRMKTLEADLTSACNRFGINPNTTQITSLRGASETVRYGMNERATAFTNAVERLRGLGTLNGVALAASLENRAETHTILAAADLLNESEAGTGNELQAAFSDGPEVFDLDTSDDE